MGREAGEGGGKAQHQHQHQAQPPACDSTEPGRHGHPTESRAHPGHTAWVAKLRKCVGRQHRLHPTAKRRAGGLAMELGHCVQRPGSRDKQQCSRYSVPLPTGRRPPCRCAFWAWKGCAAFIRLTGIGEDQTHNFPHLEDSGP